MMWRDHSPSEDGTTLRKAIIILAWLVVATFTVIAAGFVMMAVDGYDFWDPDFPLPDTLADTGYNLAWIGQLVGYALMLATWIVLSVWLVSLRDRIPTTWKHSKAAVWLWWIVPVAFYWMPREVYMEAARASLPSQPQLSKRLVDRWWLSMVLFLAANQVVFIGYGPGFLAVVTVTAAVAIGLAAHNLSRLVSTIDQPEITFETTSDYGEGPLPAGLVEPTVPGWYNDPTGQASHQAYWDGGRYTGAVRPDPRRFPTQPQHGMKEKDLLKTWLIVFAIVFTLTSMVLTFIQAFTLIEEEGGFDIASFLGIL
jgi:hypothetical protein